MSVLLNLLSAHAQTFALFVVIAPVPYASLGEGRIVGDRSPSFHISCKASTRQGRSVLGRSRMTPPVRPRRPAPDQPAAGIFREHLHRRTTAAGTSAVRGGRDRIHLPLGPLTSLSVLSDNGGSGERAEEPPSRKLHDLDGPRSGLAMVLFFKVNDHSSHRGRQ